MELMVRILQARKLIIPGSLSRVKNTYVYVRYASESFRSKTNEKTTDAPSWMMPITIKNVISEDMDITIDVYRERFWGFSDVHIGKGVIRIPSRNHVFHSWVHISSNGNFTGEVMVQLKWKSLKSSNKQKKQLDNNDGHIAERLPSLPPDSYYDARRTRHSTMPILPLFTSTTPEKDFTPHPAIYPNNLTSSPIEPKLDNPPVEICEELLPASIERFDSNDLKLMVPSIGCGAYGEVNCCLLSDRIVAVKTFHISVHTNNGARSFAREAKAMHQLKSPHIVKLIGIATNNTGKRQIIMEYMNNGNLRKYLDDRLERIGKNHDLNELLPIALQIAEGLAFLHSKNIIHRDIKPANVLLNKHGKVKLGDFGVAREDSEQSKTNAMGSTPWMAPEVIRSTNYSTSADIFSLGVILTELDTLVPPYAKVKCHLYSLQNQIIQGKRPSLSRNCPAWYKELVDQCLDANPNCRPTAAEIVNRLEHQLKNSISA